MRWSVHTIRVGRNLRNYPVSPLTSSLLGAFSQTPLWGWFVRLVGLIPAITFAQLPATGPLVPELNALGQAKTVFMNARGFEAGTIAVMKDSKLVLRQGYGWRDASKASVIHPDNLFRLASVSKTMTVVAITQLINAGKISKDTKVYAYLGIQPWRGVLGDARTNDITVQHLLDHTAGWDNGIASSGGDVFNTVSISTSMGLDHPATAREVIGWAFSKPLDFAPGAKSVYSNFGYMVLGRVIEKASGKSYIDYLRDDLFGPVGINNIILSRSRPADRDPWEIWYAGTATRRSAVDFPANVTVRTVDGGYYFESFDSFGGLSASAGDLCRYMLSYWVAGAKREPTAQYSWNYVFYGSLPGTSAVIHQRVSQTRTSASGLEFVTLFNERTGSGDDDDEAHAAILNAAAGITSWPATGGGSIQWKTSCTDVRSSAGSVTVQLVRSGLSTLPIKVSYATYSKTAGTTDYVPSSGTIAFAAGEAAKDISITLLPNSPRAVAREFLLELISASGGAWFGDQVSSVVRITDDAPTNPGRLINLSILTDISASDPVFTIGAVIGGASASSKALLVRAAGPSLTQLGVEGALADPKLDLFSGSIAVASNDNWGGTAALNAAMAQVGAFAYTSATSRDAAVFNPAMPAGNSTMEISAVAGATGTVIAELYDATRPEEFTAATPRLINVSVLKQISSGQTLTAGFVIGGATPKQVLIRAIGSTLGAAPFSVPNVMGDPKLDLFSGQVVINSNDDWGGGAALATAFTNVGAFALDASSRDAALLVTLPPASYTARVSGAGSASGLTLVEVYEVP